MPTSTAPYELLLFLVNNLETNAKRITAQTIGDSTILGTDQAMLKEWSNLSTAGQEEIAADVEHVLSGISKDLAFLL